MAPTAADEKICGEHDLLKGVLLVLFSGLAYFVPLSTAYVRLTVADCCITAGKGVVYAIAI